MAKEFKYSEELTKTFVLKETSVSIVN